MRTLKAIWRDFIANFSSHGLRRVFDPIGTSPTLISRCFRLIWFFAWVSAAFFTISHMGQTVQQYLRYQTITSTHIRRGDPIKFPTVTFCPGHSLSINHAIFWATKNCNSSINKTDDTIAICSTFNNLLAGKDVKSWKNRAKLNVNLNTVIMKKSLDKFPQMVKNLRCSLDDMMVVNESHFNMEAVGREAWKFDHDSSTSLGRNCYTFVGNKDDAHVKRVCLLLLI